MLLVPDGGDGPGLAGKPPPGGGAMGQGGGEHLDRHRPLERRVACLEHDAHSTAAQDLENLIRSPGGRSSRDERDRAGREMSSQTVSPSPISSSHSSSTSPRRESSAVREAPGTVRREAKSRHPSTCWPPPSALARCGTARRPRGGRPARLARPSDSRSSSERRRRSRSHSRGREAM